MYTLICLNELGDPLWTLDGDADIYANKYILF